MYLYVRIYPSIADLGLTYLFVDFFGIFLVSDKARATYEDPESKRAEGARKWRETVDTVYHFVAEL